MHNIKKILRADFEKNPKRSIFGPFWDRLAQNLGNQNFFWENCRVHFQMLWHWMSMPKMNKILRAVFEKNYWLPTTTTTNGSDPIGPIRPTGLGSKKWIKSKSRGEEMFLGQTENKMGLIKVYELWSHFSCFHDLRTRDVLLRSEMVFGKMRIGDRDQ